MRKLEELSPLLKVTELVSITRDRVRLHELSRPVVVLSTPFLGMKMKWEHVGEEEGQVSATIL